MCRRADVNCNDARNGKIQLSGKTNAHADGRSTSSIFRLRSKLRYETDKIVNMFEPSSPGNRMAPNKRVPMRNYELLIYGSN